jgi:hypothetical protein
LSCGAGSIDEEATSSEYDVRGLRLVHNYRTSTPLNIDIFVIYRLTLHHSNQKDDMAMTQQPTLEVGVNLLSSIPRTMWTKRGCTK